MLQGYFDSTHSWLVPEVLSTQTDFRVMTPTSENSIQEDFSLLDQQPSKSDPTTISDSFVFEAVLLCTEKALQASQSCVLTSVSGARGPGGGACWTAAWGGWMQSREAAPAALCGS